MKKRVIWMAVLMAALMLAAAFPLSAGGAKNAQGGARETGPSLKGMEIVIGNWWENYDVSSFEPKNDQEERILEMRKKIQVDYDFKISQKQIAGWEQMSQVAATSIMAGKPAAHIFFLQPNWAMMLLNRNLLANVSGVSSVDLTSSKPVNWNRAVMESMTFDGKAYAVAIGYGTSRHATGVYFNKRLFREAGLNPDLPYDMQKNGSWTWNAYMDLCKKLTRDINNDGIIDTYAMPQDLSTDILDALVASNGANYIGRDAIGKFTNATNSNEFIQALQFAMRMRAEGIMKPRPEGSNWDWYKAEFRDGKVAMMVAQEYMANEIQTMRDDWGFVIFPKGPACRDYRYSCDENVMVIPSTYTPEEVEKILFAAKLWYTPVDDDDDAWKLGMYNQYRDSRAVDETLAMFRDPKYGSIKNYVYIPGLERGDIAWQMFWWEGDPAQLVETVSQSWGDLIHQANGAK